MLRPRIRASVATQAGQAHQVRMWLQQNTTHEWATEARDLIAQIDAFIEQPGRPKNPPEAASERTSLAAIIAMSNIPEEQRNTGDVTVVDERNTYFHSTFEGKL